MICDSLHSNETGLSATRGTLTRLLGAAVRPEILNSLTSWATCAAVAFICRAKSMVARFQTNSPVSWMLATLCFHEVEENPMIRVVIEPVEKAIGRQIYVAHGIARRDPADRARRDDGIERIVLEAVAARRLVVVQILFNHARHPLPVIARSAATKQSHIALRGGMDCFAALAMTDGWTLRWLSNLSCLSPCRAAKGPRGRSRSSGRATVPACWRFAQS